MLVDIVMGSKAVWRILAVLAESPGQGITKEEIKKVTKLGGNSLFRSLRILVKNNIVNSRKFGKRTYYSMNLVNDYSKQINEIVNLERKEMNNMNQGIVVVLREYVRKIIDVIDAEGIYVFGSIVKSSYTKESDIDIAIITEKRPSTKKIIIVEKIAELLKKRFGREIQTHFFTKDEFNQKNKLAEQVQRDGIKLI